MHTPPCAGVHAVHARTLRCTAYHSGPGALSTAWRTSRRAGRGRPDHCRERALAGCAEGPAAWAPPPAGAAEAAARSPHEVLQTVKARTKTRDGSSVQQTYQRNGKEEERLLAGGALHDVVTAVTNPIDRQHYAANSRAVPASLMRYDNSPSRHLTTTLLMIHHCHTRLVVESDSLIVIDGDAMLLRPRSDGPSAEAKKSSSSLSDAWPSMPCRKEAAYLQCQRGQASARATELPDDALAARRSNHNTSLSARGLRSAHSTVLSTPM